MRINHILFFLGTIFLAACIGKSTPDGIIPRDKMVNILIQLHQVDGSLVSYNQSPDSLYKHGMGKYLHLFKSHSIDSAQFRKSLMFYANQPEMFDKMYDDILIKLNAKTDSLNKVRIAVVKQDSAKNARRENARRDSIKNAEKVKAAKDTAKHTSEPKKVLRKGGKN